jgi:hypothetical protein
MRYCDTQGQAHVSNDQLYDKFRTIIPDKECKHLSNFPAAVTLPVRLLVSLSVAGITFIRHILIHTYRRKSERCVCVHCQ